MDTRNVLGILLILVFFGAFAWFIFYPEKNSLIFFLVPFALILIFFILLISTVVLGNRQAKKALNDMITNYGFTPEQILDANIQTTISTIFSKYFGINQINKFDKVYTKDTSKGKITIFNAHYASRRRGRY